MPPTGTEAIATLGTKEQKLPEVVLKSAGTR
jgi:hypothetical protein